jgi:hypothetical protein
MPEKFKLGHYPKNHTSIYGALMLSLRGVSKR